MPGTKRIEVFTGPGQRRRWIVEAKAQIVAESYETCVIIRIVAGHPKSDVDQLLP